MAARAPTCRTCAAALARCWVCGEAHRCAACQQCARCEGLIDDVTHRAAAAPALGSVPSVRLRRTKSPFTPKPIPKAQTFRPAAKAASRARARRIAPPKSAALLLPSAIWYLRAAVVPALMLLAAYLAYGQFQKSAGLLLAAACVIAFYLPYVVVTPVRRKGDFFPLGDEGPGLPVVMVIGGGIVGVLAGVLVGFFFLGGEAVGKWVGIGVGVIAFHALYFVTLAEKAKSLK